MNSEVAIDPLVTANDQMAEVTRCEHGVAAQSDALSARLGASGWARAAVLTEPAARHG